MKTPEFNYWIVSLGWTLLHSLWQGLLITLGYILVRRLVPASHAARRYQISAFAISAVLIASVVTFLIYTSSLNEKAESSVATSSLSDGIELRSITISASKSLIETASLWVNDQALVIVIAWLVGVLVFSLRLAFAFRVSSRLRSEAAVITGYWQQRMAALVAELEISAHVILAECASIASPIVIGFLKPIVLLPVGMLSGLTVEQVESILLHELAHIRRRDYLFNVLQSIMEVVFFFNPFVWMFSSCMRIEREQCCDDIVVRFKNPLVYAKALHQLESERTWSTTMGLAAAGSKNQLLKRIKRIMETTETTETNTRRIIPALMIVGLMIIGSWLSVQARRANLTDDKLTDISVADTLIERQHAKKGSRHEQKIIMTFDNYNPPPPNAEVPAPEDHDPIALVEDIPLTLNFADDTIPPTNGNVNENYEQFNKAFTDQFKARFGDFYKQNAKEIDQMLNEVTTQLESVQPDAGMNRELLKQLELNERHVAGLQLSESLREEKLHELTLQRSLLKLQLAEQVRGQAEEQRVLAEQNFREIDDEADKVRERLALTEQLVTEETASMEKMMDPKNPFNKEFNDELIKDHYLTEGERLTGLIWEDERITINGKVIRDADAPKYNQMLRSYKKNFKMKGKIKSPKPAKAKQKEKEKGRVGSAE